MTTEDDDLGLEGDTSTPFLTEPEELEFNDLTTNSTLVEPMVEAIDISSHGSPEGTARQEEAQLIKGSALDHASIQEQQVHEEETLYSSEEECHFEESIPPLLVKYNNEGAELSDQAVLSSFRNTWGNERWDCFVEVRSPCLAGPLPSCTDAVYPQSLSM